MDDLSNEDSAGHKPVEYRRWCPDEPGRRRDHRSLLLRVQALEDCIGHFYGVINELRKRMHELEAS
jgi:hypothetical protein